MSKIGTTTNTITLNYLPQNLVINSASGISRIPFNDLTQLNVSVNGTEIVSLASNATIETAFSVNNQVGGTAVDNEGLPKQTVLQLADGKIENVNSILFGFRIFLSGMMIQSNYEYFQINFYNLRYCARGYRSRINKIVHTKHHKIKI